MSEYGRFVSTNTFFSGTVSLNAYLNTLDLHKSLFQELQLEKEEYHDAADLIFESFSDSYTFGPSELEDLRTYGHLEDVSIGEKEYQAFKELYTVLTVDHAVGIDYRIPSPAYENRYWVLNKDENDIIRVAKAELTDDYQVDITNLERDIFLSSPDSFSSEYWAEPSIGFFPNHQYDPFDEWMYMRSVDMHLKVEDASSFFKTCVVRKEPSLKMCTRLMSDQRVPRDHELMPKCQRIIQIHAFVTSMTIIIPVLVVILTLLTIIKCMVGQAKRRRAVERELARIEARNQMSRMQDIMKFDVLEVGKNDPPPVYGDVVTVAKN